MNVNYGVVVENKYQFDTTIPEQDTENTDWRITRYVSNRTL